MATTLTSSTHQVSLANYVSGNPFTIASGTSIKSTSGHGVYGGPTNFWTLASAGYVSGAGNVGGNASYGVLLIQGNFTNTGLVKGGKSTPALGGAGVLILNGLITNGGTIDGGGGTTGGVGVATEGTLTNQAGGYIAGGYGIANSVGVGGDGAYLFGAAAARLSNAGTIVGGSGGFEGATKGTGAPGLFVQLGTATNTGLIVGGEGGVNTLTVGFSGGYGLNLTGGAVTNSAGGTISGGTGGVDKASSTSTSGGGGAGANVASGKTLTNAGLIEGGEGGYGGSISGAGGNGVRLGGVLVNLAGAVITGGSAPMASGDYTSNGGLGVYALTGAKISNAGTIEGGHGGSFGFPSGAGGAGVVSAGAATLLNTGVVIGGYYGGNSYSSGPSGAGAVLKGGYVSNSTTGHIVGANSGEAKVVTSVYQPGGDGLDLTAAGTVQNYGVIQGGGADGAGGVGVSVSGGYVENESGAWMIGGTSGVNGAGGAALVVGGGASLFNAGVLQGGGGKSAGGVGLTDGAVAISGKNYGIIEGGAGGAAGVLFQSASTLLNFGDIYGSGVGGDGVSLLYGGWLNNDKGPGLIRGDVGVYAGPAGAATVLNYGTIIGASGVAVKFLNTADRLVVENGAHFTGSVAGGGGTLMLSEAGGALTGLGGTGVLSGSVSMTFSGFGTYGLTNSSWTLAGANVLSASQSLVNSGTATLSGTLVDQGVLVNLAGALITIANAGALEAQGVVSNAGTIALSSSTTNTDLRVLAAGATLSGGGVVSLGGTKARVLGATAASTLTNVDNTLTGTGFIGANTLTLINQSKGVIDAVGAFGLTVGTKGETLTNQGLMEATGGGILIIANTTVANLGGTILATNGSPVDLQDDVVRGGGITASGTGVVKVNVAGGELDGTTNAVSLSGVAFIVNGSNETLEGSIANSGKINLIASTSTSDLIIGAAGATLSGGGQVNMTNSLSNRIYGLASGDTLTNVDNRIDGAGVLGNGIMTLVNAAKGQIVGNQNLALTIDTGTNTIVNAGLIENVGKGGTLVKSAVNNTGTLLAATAGTLNLAGAVTGAGVGQINGGALYVQQAFAENVTFSGSTGVLELGDSQAFTGTVTGLSKTGTSWLDLVDIGFFAAKTKATYSGTTASGTLTVTDGTHTAHIALQGNYLAATWTLSGDGHGGTKVVDPSAGAAPLAQALSSFAPAPAAVATGAPAWRPPRLSPTLAHGRAA